MVDSVVCPDMCAIGSVAPPHDVGARAPSDLAFGGCPAMARIAQPHRSTVAPWTLQNARPPSTSPSLSWAATSAPTPPGRTRDSWGAGSRTPGSRSRTGLSSSSTSTSRQAWSLARSGPRCGCRSRASRAPAPTRWRAPGRTPTAVVDDVSRPLSSGIAGDPPGRPRRSHAAAARARQPPARHGRARPSGAGRCR